MNRRKFIKQGLLWIPVISCNPILAKIAKAWNTSVAGCSTIDSPAGCGGTSTFVGNPGDTETFEYQAADFCCTEFTEVDGGDHIINTYDTAQVKNGTHALSIALTGEDQEDNYVQADLGSADDDFVTDFWYYLFDAADYNSTYINSGTLSSDPSDGSGWAIRHDHLQSSSADIYVATTINNDTSIPLTTNAWYRLEVDYNRNGGSTLKIYNASDVLLDTLDFTAPDGGIRYINFGCIYSNANATNTQYYDDIRYKSSGGAF